MDKMAVSRKAVVKITFSLGSGYRTSSGSSNLKPYSTTSCNMTVMQDENAIGLVET